MRNTPHKSAVRVTEIDIDPAFLLLFRAFLADHFEASIANKTGVITLQAFAGSGHPAKIRVLEIFEDDDAYLTHLSSDHFMKYQITTAEMIRSATPIDADPLMAKTMG